MKYIFAVFTLLLAAGPVQGQHSLAMHTHSGPGSYSACLSGRWDGPIQLFPPDKAGNLNHKVSTANPRAQQFFNQGLTFFYGFDAESAMRSFHQASVEDPNLAMAYWGVALAAGGDLNIPINDPCMTLAVQQSTKAYSLLNRASDAEKLYINALAERYATRPQPGSDAPVRDPQQLGVYYALAMKTVYQKLGSQDPDAGGLYAYSLMNLRPWLWWTTSGKPSAEITEALSVLAAGLSRFPAHIGLNHIQIHAMEEGPIDQQGKARPSAEFLLHNAPFITPHLRHMPAHTFLLLGDWNNVIAANQHAVDADRPWADLCRDNISAPECNQLLVGHYYSHDMLFLDVGYNNQGLWEKVQPLSDQLEANVQQFIRTQPGLEHYLTTKVMMMVHFGKWEELTKLPPPQNDMPDPSDPGFCSKLTFKLASATWYFGRAMGHASLKESTDADVNGFQQAQSCVQSAGVGWGNNAANDILNVVHWRMLERIARMNGRKEASKEFALLAVETEDLLDYDEPPGWYISSRETYGASLYLNGDYQSALRVFHEDQLRRPNNSRSLFGIWQVFAVIHSPEAKAAEQRFRAQWKSSVLPTIQNM